VVPPTQRGRSSSVTDSSQAAVVPPTQRGRSSSVTDSSPAGIGEPALRLRAAELRPNAASVVVANPDRAELLEMVSR
jgi:hypothetical protein